MGARAVLRVRSRLLRLRARTARRGCRPRERSEEHTSELQSQSNLVCRLLLEKKKTDRQRLRLPVVQGEQYRRTAKIASSGTYSRRRFTTDATGRAWPCCTALDFRPRTPDRGS